MLLLLLLILPLPVPLFVIPKGSAVVVVVVVVVAVAVVVVVAVVVAVAVACPFVCHPAGICCCCLPWSPFAKERVIEPSLTVSPPIHPKNRHFDRSDSQFHRESRSGEIPAFRCCFFVISKEESALAFLQRHPPETINLRFPQQNRVSSPQTT
ncbi:MAG: hypothetical protein ABI286_00100 [Edaphobacter sp.]